MAYILDIATAVPAHKVTVNDTVAFYSRALKLKQNDRLQKKIALLAEKTRIQTRYSCIPDFNGKSYELFTAGNFNQGIDKRSGIYKEKIVPLAALAIDRLLKQTKIRTRDITHLVTVSCTGLSAPGIEFELARHYALDHVEKSAINFIGCYAAIKALKHANYIAQSDPDACILIACAELCSIHFTPSASEENLVPNLLFSDGAAAVIVCGNENKYTRKKRLLHIDSVGFATLPGTADLMTWNISPVAFRMVLDKTVPAEIKQSIGAVISDFLGLDEDSIDFWAIHPGGIAILNAIKSSLKLSANDLDDSLHVLQHYGNMSSPTILFVLKRILDRIATSNKNDCRSIFTCAFGPGLSIELMLLNAVDTSLPVQSKSQPVEYVIQDEVI